MTFLSIRSPAPTIGSRFALRTRLPTAAASPWPSTADLSPSSMAPRKRLGQQAITDYLAAVSPAGPAFSARARAALGVVGLGTAAGTLRSDWAASAGRVMGPSTAE